MPLYQPGQAITIKRPVIGVYGLQIVGFFLGVWLAFACFPLFYAWYRSFVPDDVLSGLYALITSIVLVGVVYFLVGRTLNRLWAQALMRSKFEKAPYNFMNVRVTEHRLTAHDRRFHKIHKVIESDPDPKFNGRIKWDYVQSYHISDSHESHG